MKNYFQGWYFKIQSKLCSVAFIPARHADKYGRLSASIQIITDEEVCNVVYSSDDFQILNATGPSLRVSVGDCLFSSTGMKVSIQTEGLSVSGNLRFDNPRRLRGDIMGPFRYVPGMECRHTVVSLYHEVSGELTINGKTHRFNHDAGYIEGDRGHSFPSVYAWTQCLIGGKTPVSLMLSVADIPIGGFLFTGIIGFVYLNGKTYRIATYCGAKAVHIGGGKLVIRQKDWCLTAELPQNNPHRLRAPVHGEMVRLIKEDITCEARYRFTVKDALVWEATVSNASFEYEYDS